jgi:hypothetical protein
MATWLARRLQLAGYRTWCYGTAPLAGESADESVRVLIENRAVQYLPILSCAAVEDADLMGRCGLACGKDELTIPCWTHPLDPASLSTKLRGMTPIRFDEGWSAGLGSLLQTLQFRGVATEMDSDRGRAIALRSYVPEPVTRLTPERVFANVFGVTLPSGVIICELEEELTEDAKQKLRRTWAFVEASPTKLLAFDNPPTSIRLVPKERLPEYAWNHFAESEGIKSIDVVKELIWRSLEVSCYRAGLVWCDDRKKFYFPHLDKPQRNVNYRHIDGRNTRVGVTGEKTLRQR